MTLDLDNSMRLVKVPIEKLVPHPKNPRIDLKPGMPMYEKLYRSIKEHTYIDPIIWNQTTGYIIAGHQRFQVLKDIAEEEGITLTSVPVIAVRLPEDKELTFLVGDNKITGVWDQEKLKQIMSEIPEDELALTGFDDFEIQSLLDTDIGEIDSDFIDTTDEGPKDKAPKTIVCPHCGKEFEL